MAWPNIDARREAVALAMLLGDVDVHALAAEFSCSPSAIRADRKVLAHFVLFRDELGEVMREERRKTAAGALLFLVERSARRRARRAAWPDRSGS